MWQFLETRQQWSLPHQLTLPFMNDSFSPCNVVWQHFAHCRTSLKISQSSHTLWLHYQLSLYNIKFFVFNSLHNIFSRSRFHLKKALSLLIISSNSSPIKVLPWNCGDLVTSSGSTSDLGSLVVSTTSTATSSMEVSNPLRDLRDMRTRINFVENPVTLHISTSF